MAGRVKLPDNIKVLRGTDQPCRMNPDQPEYESTRLACPFGSDQPEHAAYWQQIVPQLIRAGVATDIDESALRVLCEKWIEYRTFQSKVDEYGPVIKAPKSDYIQLSPYYTGMKQALADWQKMMTEFGMTPASRTKIKVDKDKGGNGKGRFDGI